MNYLKKHAQPIAAVLLLLIALAFAGVNSAASASPLLAPPPASSSLSEAPELDGHIYSVQEKDVGKIGAIKREEMKYGTGVLRGNSPEIGTASVFTPDNASGNVLVYQQPTNSLSELDAPSDLDNISDADLERINAAIRAGDTVILVNAYGDHNPQYAGQLNGVRIVNAVQAYKHLDPSRAPPERVACYGFSGGGIDCARVLEYRHANGVIDTVIVDSGPTDLPGFLVNPGAQNGLGWTAAAGLEESMTAEQRAVLYPNLRPSAIVGVKLLRAASNLIPVPTLVVGLMTVSGVLFPLPLEAAFLPGALDKPEVQALLADISPGIPEEKFDGTVVFRYNETDAFVPPGVHARPLAALLREDGTDVVEVTNHGQTAPGHAMMSSDELLGYLSGNMPVESTDTYTKPAITDKLVNTALFGALYGISVYGEWLNEEAPAALDELDRVILDADKALDQVISAPADTAEVVATAVGQGQQLLEQVATPQSEAPTVNSETAIQAADEWLVPHDAQAVEDFVSSAPVKEVVDSLPVTLPPLPAPGDQVDVGGFRFAMPPLPAPG